jgi:uncharacterized membrane protein
MSVDPGWMKALLAVHITAGAGSFLLAPVPLATAKGGRAHRRWGMVYLWCMGGVAATAFPMALYRPVLFLALVAVFSFYLAFSGYRVLKLKDLARGGSARPVDWIAGTLASSAGALLVLLAWLRPAAVQHMGWVAILFGVLCMRAAAEMMWSFVRKPKDRMFWWYSHLSGFIASYIAAWTAFSVVTLPRIFGNHFWFWTWPTALGVPAIAAITIYYKRKFTPRPRPAATPAMA